MPQRFVLVATEESGDVLGASLIAALKVYYPQASFEGIGGNKMIQQGLHSFYPLERLSVMGFIEPLKRLPELLRIRQSIKKHVLTCKPTAFIGIDAPDFNLSLEKTFKKKGIKSVHMVSPTVWAWRKSRIKTIKKAVDLMLALFPFELPIYEANQIHAVCIGHPLADAIPLQSDPSIARFTHFLPQNKKIVALLPGSRAQELDFLLKPYLETAKWLYQKDNSLIFVTACANNERLEQFNSIYQSIENAPPVEILPSAQIAMQVADAVLVTSGTATLESMLVKRPTVVAYKMRPLTYSLAKRLLKVPFIAMPNILANKQIMPEVLQEEVCPQVLGPILYDFLQKPEKFSPMLDEFFKIHTMLKRNAGEAGAKAIVELIKEN